jgi:hypothetical protein
MSKMGRALKQLFPFYIDLCELEEYNGKHRNLTLTAVKEGARCLRKRSER